MEKLKIKVVPDWREMCGVLKWITTVFFIAFMGMLLFLSCADEWYIGDSREELAREMFVVDSLMRTIMLQLDSTNADFKKFYIDAQKINNGH